ncbi:hypothetical protein DPMN_048023 [Dreissena polymorpha]|uniref:Uncharacterized protein n=1 Tax=Dreissena polymorpha TaxID=45954 RepID=A0A9D4D8S8_DREPO|nr:hypothetical protein DPMN_048023 [Dreissena polymorpha]
MALPFAQTGMWPVLSIHVWATHATILQILLAGQTAVTVAKEIGTTPEMYKNNAAWKVNMLEERNEATEMFIHEMCE